MAKKPMREVLKAAAAALIALTGLPLAASAQGTASVWDGVYTDAQADRGAGQYVQHCAVCHGKALEGNGESPPLVGQFIPDWGGTTLDLLYDKVQVTMPLNAPGTLRPAVAADILAFLLKSNNFPAGAKELEPAPETLKSVSFDSSKPKPAPAAKKKTK